MLPKQSSYHNTLSVFQLFNVISTLAICKPLVPTVLTYTPITLSVKPPFALVTPTVELLPCIVFAPICQSSGFPSFLLCLLSGGSMLRGFFWLSLGYHLCSTPRHAFPCCLYSLALMPVSAIIFFSLSFSLLPSLPVLLSYPLLYHICHLSSCVIASGPQCWCITYTSSTIMLKLDFR